MNIIRTGHYRNKNSSGDSYEIIRVLGESLEKPGFFDLQEKDKFGINKTISEYDLTNNYEFIVTETSEIVYKVPNKLFDGLEDIEVAESKVDNFIKNDFINDEVYKEPKIYTPKKIIDTQPVVQNNIINEKEKFIIDILERIKLYDKPNIVNISVGIPINYDLIKLFETVKMLNLDVSIVTEVILSNSNILDKITTIVKNEIIKILINGLKIEEPVEELIQENEKEPVEELIQEPEKVFVDQSNESQIYELLAKFKEKYNI